MDTQAFWNVIGHYNSQTWAVQTVLLILLLSAVGLSYTQRIRWAAKFALGLTDLFIALAFFAWYGTEPIQEFFALPLFLLCGGLFLWESRKYKDDILEKPNGVQAVLLLLYLSYPVISILLGHAFPQMVTHIMPCPVVSLSIAVYGGYKRKSKALLTLLTIWGLTGIKAILFRAYEDIILLLAGLYCLTLLIREIKRSKVE